MIVLTSDRPPELRGIGAGQTIDQIGLYGSAARWFCEVGTHDADDAGLLHMRSTACRAFGEATAGRGPVHLNLSWRDPLGPEPRPRGPDRQRPARARGHARRATADGPDRGPRTGRASCSARSDRGRRAGNPRRDRRRPPHRPGPGGTDRGARGRRRVPDPRRADLAAPLRPPRPLGRRRRLRPDRSNAARAAEPDLVVRFGDMPTSKPLRAWLPDADRRSTRSSSIHRDAGTSRSRRAGAVVRADAAAVADRHRGAAGSHPRHERDGTPGSRPRRTRRRRSRASSRNPMRP